MRTPARFFFRQYVKRSAGTYYRIDVPCRVLSQHYQTYMDETQNILTPDDLVKYFMGMLNHDLVHAYATGGSFGLKLLNLINRTPCELKPDGTIVNPPAFVVDLDDNLDYVNPLNPAFAFLGTRIPGVGELVPGEDVNIVMGNGEVVTLWRDGETRDAKGRLFDIAANLKGIRQMKRVLKRAQGASFTTDRLRKYYEEHYGVRNGYTFPNSVIQSDYPQIEIVPQNVGKVKVMWQGGDSHYPDWFSIRDGVKVAAEKFPEIEWTFWGTRYRHIDDQLPPESFKYHDWVPYEAYKVRLATMDYDIAVAPLVDNIFNEGKSCIKWYESSILLKPKPVLAARVPPYIDEMTDGENCLLYSDNEEFVRKLEMLVRSKELRDRLANNAKEWVLKNRSAEVTVPAYGRWLHDTAARYSERRGKKHLRGMSAWNLRDA